MSSLYQDVVVVGTGFGACPPALALARKGRKVVMIERGRRWSPEEFRPSQDAKDYTTRIEPISSSNAGIQAPRIVGGGSVVYSATSFRAPTETFEHIDQRNKRKFWPDSINRKILDPFYAVAERMLNVRQYTWEYVPKKGVVFARFLTNAGLGVDLAPAAMLNNCQQFGFCRYGCPNSSKNDLTSNYLPAAEELGVEIWQETQVEEIRPHSGGYQLFLTRGKEKMDVIAKSVVLGAGTWGTAQILMKSAHNFPKLSKQVGRDFHANGNHLFGFQSNEGEWASDLYKGRENPGVYSFSHWRENRIILLLCTLFPMEIFGAAQVLAPGVPAPSFYGREHKRWVLDNFQNRVLSMEICGLSDANYLDFKLEGGIAKPYGRYDDIYMNYYKRAQRISEDLARANNANIIPTRIIVGGAPMPEYLTFSNHHMGSCKIASDPNQGVIDDTGEVFNYPNLFVTDGSAIPGPLGVNPSLTILATSELLTSRLIQKRF